MCFSALAVESDLKAVDKMGLFPVGSQAILLVEYEERVRELTPRLSSPVLSQFQTNSQ